MVKKCIYCSIKIDSDSVVDMCQRCMYQVWGDKMAKAIIEGMERERDIGNLNLGQVGRIDKDEKSEIENLVPGTNIVESVEADEVSSEELVMAVDNTEKRVAEWQGMGRSERFVS